MSQSLNYFGLLFSFICFSNFTFSQNQFVNVAIEKGINHSYGVGVAGGGVSFCDFNNDGLDDLTLATQSGSLIEFYENIGGAFVQINPLVDDTSEVKQIMWVDYNNDGDKDLYISTFNGPNRLYQNDGNLNLMDVTQAAGLPTDIFDSFGACWGDIDRDGFLDIYFTQRNLNFSSNQAWLYRNNGDGTFEDITNSAGVADSEKAAFQSAFLDINEDLWQDIYTAHDKTKVNTLLKNNGDLTYSDISQSSNSNVQINAMSVSVGDYDNDGDLDIYVSNTPDGNKLLRNNGNETFLEVANIAGVSFNGIGWGSNFLDADNDGDLDLYASGMTIGTDFVSSEFYENIGFGNFSSAGFGFEGDTVSSFGNAVGDFNNDGFPDIFVNNTFPFGSHLWENQSLGNSNNFLKVNLTGILSNRGGIGSWIKIFANGKKQVRYTHCGIGFLGQNSETEIFGLGGHQMVDSIQVHWLTGHVDRLYDITANQTITIVEGSSTNGDIYVDPEIGNNTSTKYDQLTKKEIKIFPNPSKGLLNIFFNNQQIQEILIYNQMGTLVWRAEFSQSTSSYSNNFNFSKGIYFVKTRNKTGAIQIIKWIIY